MEFKIIENKIPIYHDDNIIIMKHGIDGNLDYSSTYALSVHSAVDYEQIHYPELEKFSISEPFIKVLPEVIFIYNRTLLFQIDIATMTVKEIRPKFCPYIITRKGDIIGYNVVEKISVLLNKEGEFIELKRPEGLYLESIYGAIYRTTEKDVNTISFYSYDTFKMEWSKTRNCKMAKSYVIDGDTLYCYWYKDNNQSILSIHIPSGMINWETILEYKAFCVQIILSKDRSYVRCLGAFTAIYDYDLSTGELLRKSRKEKNNRYSYYKLSFDDRVYFNTGGLKVDKKKVPESFGCYDIDAQQIKWTYNFFATELKCNIIDVLIPLGNGHLLCHQNNLDKTTFIFDPDSPENIKHRIFSDGKLVSKIKN